MTNSYLNTNYHQSKHENNKNNENKTKKETQRTSIIELVQNTDNFL